MAPTRDHHFSDKELQLLHTYSVRAGIKEAVNVDSELDGHPPVQTPGVHRRDEGQIQQSSFTTCELFPE